MSIVERKLRHVDVCLTYPVEYATRTTGFERVDLPYRALPETNLHSVDTSTEFLGKRLSAPILIGAMTGGAERAKTINRNLAEAAEELGVGLMLGSQRVMLENASAVDSFAVRAYAPNALVIGNLGAAQLNKGYGTDHVTRAIELISADALAIHTNPLQEALQESGDEDFTSLVATLRRVVPAVPYPLLLKEVGHGLSREVVRAVGDVGFAALDVAGAGGTSWAKVEDFVRFGEVRHRDLVEWGIATADALVDAHDELPSMPLVASGGMRTGLDVAKAVAMGARVVAVARPLLAPALESAEAVKAALRSLIRELRIAMHCAGAATIADLAALTVTPSAAPLVAPRAR